MTLNLTRRRTLAGAIAGVALAGAASSQGSARRGIAQTAFVPIGGLDQWISIKGDDRGNPVLLVVHGGPGEAQWPQASKYIPWQRKFTVVQWDQRGAGHTFGRYGTNTPEMTLDRIGQDGIELADYLCRTLGKRNIIVFGHSWGSIIAVNMIKRRPELFAAYAGSGMVGSWKGASRAKFNLVLAKARADGDMATVSELETSGPPDPSNADAVFAFDDRVYPLWPPADKAWIAALRADRPRLLKAYPKDFKDFEDGFKFSAERAVPDQIRTDLPATAGALATPFFLIQGRDDVITPTADALAYFDILQAPQKQSLLIPESGHFAFMTAADAFLNALVDMVRPVAIAHGA